MGYWPWRFRGLFKVSKNVIRYILSRLNLKVAEEYDSGWEIPTKEEELIKEWCIDNHNEVASDLINFLNYDLADLLKLDDDEAAEISDEPEYYESQ